MKLEVLVSTMHRDDLSFVEHMNLNTDAVVVNQTNWVGREIIRQAHTNILFISNTERGLSNSRNRLLENASGDVCMIADDDIEYLDGYKEIVLDAHMRYPQADIITFQLLPSAGGRSFKKYLPKECSIGLMKSMKISSVEVTFKRERLLHAGVSFNPLFGAGSRYGAGEENIFLIECIKKGLKVQYIPQPILRLKESESTWFEGFNDKYLFNRGAIFTAMFKTLAIPVMLQFALRKYKLFQGIPLHRAVSFMLAGMRDYRERARLHDLSNERIL